MENNKSAAVALILTCVCILHTKASVSLSNVTSSNQTEFIHRVEDFASRMLWMTHNRKFILPKGTILTLSPKITLPVFRNKPFNEGLNSDIQATWYFYMYFDKLGMTSDSHPWPLSMPPFYPFGSLMRHPMKQMGDAMEKVKARYTRGRKRHQRSVLSLPPPENIHGGERAVIIPKLENLLSSVGMEGRDCLLRAVCEVHEYPLHRGFGFFGELITLFFSVSKSPYAESHMPEYLKAEETGKAGECSAYFKKCKKSIFEWEKKNKYSEEMQNVIPEKRHFNEKESETFGTSHTRPK